MLIEVVPCPNCPWSLMPQHQRPPSSLAAHVLATPASTADQFFKPLIRRGMPTCGLAPSSPQHHNVRSLRTPQVCAAPDVTLSQDLVPTRTGKSHSSPEP